ncbi:MAG: 4Fe-4S cluster-binding domain-containing protein [candidate division Zixibacteria bacterium]|nr:4Fe-4S cluster-binding domain-containing protein [candidate division Zixibacteria bacterium]
MRLEHAGTEYLPVQIEIKDKSLMMIFLLEECNFTCAHCLRSDEPMDPGYKLSFRQLQLCLADCQGLESVRWVHFSGGEPTLWTERNRNLVDLLLEISKAGFTPGFTTNGSFFVDYSRCQQFFGKYLDDSSIPLRVYFSLDTFHHNFDVEKGRAESLDNVIKLKQELPRVKADLLDIAVIAVISKDLESLLPDEMIGHYESLGIAFSFVPLAPRGRAKTLSHLCPDPGSDNPDKLGAYQRFHRKESREKADKTRNRYRTDHIILIGDNYYFADPWHKVAQLGHMPDTIIRTYSSPVRGSC